MLSAHHKAETASIWGILTMKTNVPCRLDITQPCELVGFKGHYTIRELKAWVTRLAPEYQMIASSACTCIVTAVLFEKDRAACLKKIHSNLDYTRITSLVKHYGRDMDGVVYLYFW